MRQRRNVDDLHHLDTGAVDRAHGRLATCTRTLHINLHLAQAHVVSDLGAIRRSGLCCIRSILLRTTEAHLAGRRPADDIAHLVGDGDDYVVESGVYIDIAQRTDLNNLFLNCSSFLCHNSLKITSLPFSCLRQSSCGPCGYARCSWSTDRGREDPDGDGCRGSSRCPSGA